MEMTEEWEVGKSVFVSVLGGVIKYFDRGNLRKKGFICLNV